MKHRPGNLTAVIMAGAVSSAAWVCLLRSARFITEERVPLHVFCACALHVISSLVLAELSTWRPAASSRFSHHCRA